MPQMSSKHKAALITSIGYDHMEFLGDRLVDIAMHKAGIANLSVHSL